MIGWAALIAWPAVAAVLFSAFRVELALSLTMIGGFLFLPPVLQFDLPILPPFDKNTIPILAAVVFTMIAARGARGQALLKGWLPRDPVVLALLALAFVGIVGTVLTNTDALARGARVLPGLTGFDILADMSAMLFVFLPFLLARKILATPKAQRVFLIVFVFAAAIYALPALYEVRMSPQINRMIYGFFPHDWQQHVRGGGFRPVVFFSHGLVLSLFFAMAVLAALGLARITPERRALYLAVAAGLFVILVLSKSLGALAITCLLAPLCLMTNARTQLLAAAVIAAMALGYPMLRGAGLVPTDTIVSAAGMVEDQRARSMNFRFVNEDILIDHANERPLFGWGGWGRSRVFNERGRDISVTDGRWVIILGVGGWVGYIAQFGLMGWGIVALAFRRRERIAPESVVLAMMLAANLVDLVPNSAQTVLTMMLAGALAGTLERRASLPQGAADDGETPADAAPERAAPVLARRFPESPTASARDPQEPADRRAKPVLRRDFGGRRYSR